MASILISRSLSLYLFTSHMTWAQRLDSARRLFYLHVPQLTLFFFFFVTLLLLLICVFFLCIFVFLCHTRSVSMPPVLTAGFVFSGSWTGRPKYSTVLYCSVTFKKKRQRFLLHFQFTFLKYCWNNELINYLDTFTMLVLIIWVI